MNKNKEKETEDGMVLESVEKGRWTVRAALTMKLDGDFFFYWTN